MDNRVIIQKSIDYIEDNLKTELTAAELAEMAHVSVFHYYRLFQQATGFPVMQYILRRRLLHGVFAMKQGSTKTDAAMTYGFDTYAGFYKAFCREFGATPSDFLSACRAKRPYRIDITGEEQIMITHKTASRILRHWNLEKETISDIYYEGSGYKNENACYVGEYYVLKYTANPEKLQTNMDVTKALADAGLLSAIPIPAADGREYIQEGGVYFCLTRRIPGSQMNSGKFNRNTARFVGEMIGQLHLVLSRREAPVREADLLGTVRDWALPRVRETLKLTEAFCRDYTDTLTALYPSLPRQIIHRDPNPGNIICSDEGWGFIDFDLAERNVRIYDPCYAATAVLSETFGQRSGDWLEIYREILRGYDSIAHLTEAERTAIPYVILANQFVCTAWFAEQEKYAEIYEVNRNMTLWLLEQSDALKEF